MEDNIEGKITVILHSGGSSGRMLRAGNLQQISTSSLLISAQEPDVQTAELLSQFQLEKWGLSIQLRQHEADWASY